LLKAVLFDNLPDLKMHIGIDRSVI